MASEAEIKTIYADGEMMERSAAEIYCPECNDCMVFDGYFSSIKCGCGYTWQLRIQGVGTKWVWQDGTRA